MEIARTHDSLYLKEDRKRNPKEYFKFIVKESADFIEKLKNPRILDIGCATGDFLWYLSSLYPKANLTGMDVMSTLIERAKVEVPAADFVIGNVNTGEALPEIKFDAVFMLGVHSIFDDYTTWLDNLIRLIDVKGRGYIFGIFNPEDFDVLVKARRSGGEGAWEAGWNLFSKKSISLYLENKKINHKFTDWKIQIDVPVHKDDPLRSWTFKLADGTRALVNGTQVLHHFSLLELRP